MEMKLLHSFRIIILVHVRIDLQSTDFSMYTLKIRQHTLLYLYAIACDARIR